LAYQKFRVEDTYAAPDLSVIDRTVANVGNILANAGKRRQAQKDAANQFQYDLDKGAYENDTAILNGVAKSVTDKVKNELKDTGRISIESERMMKDGLAAQQMSKNQMDRAKQLDTAIRSKSDKYYNPEPDIKLVQWATHGENNDVDYRTRGERLAEAEKKVGGIETFKYDDYRADYVTKKKQQYKSVEFPLKSGGYKTVFDEATFWNGAKPGVTDQHAIEYLESEPRIGEYFGTKINKELDQEIKAMKASGDTRVGWMKGLSDVEIKNQLINEPSKNLINNKDYGVRVRDRAKYDLQEADRINSKVSFTGYQSDLNGSGGKWKNPNIVHNDAINSFAQQANNSEGQSQTVTTFGPGGRFTQKSGKAVPIDTTNPIRTDTRRGVTTRNNTGSMKLNMTGYQLMPVKAGMGPFVLKAGTTEGMVNEIKNIPLDHFDPNGKIKLQPEMRIGLNGYTINEAGVLNDVQDQLYSISTQIQEATAAGDKEKIANLETLESNLNDLKEMVGSGDYDPQDLLLAGNKAGVRRVQQDWIIPADNSDMATIKNVTGGFDLKNKEYWNDDMRTVDEAYRQRAAEAKAQNYGKQAVTEQGTVTSDGSDVDKWKRGDQYKVGEAVYYFDKLAGEWRKK